MSEAVQVIILAFAGTLSWHNSQQSIAYLHGTFLCHAYRLTH